jgi:hypothetical protein
MSSLVHERALLMISCRFRLRAPDYRADVMGFDRLAELFWRSLQPVTAS